MGRTDGDTADVSHTAAIQTICLQQTHASNGIGFQLLDSNQKAGSERSPTDAPSLSQ